MIFERDSPARNDCNRTPDPCQPNDPQGQLQKLRELNQAIASSIAEVVFMTDDEGNLTFISANIESLLGYSLEEVEELGNIQAILGENLCDREEVAAQTEIPKIEREIIDKAGQKRWFEIEVKPVSLDRGTMLYCCREISDRKHLEEELAQTRDRFEELIQVCKHELRWRNHQLQQEILERERLQKQVYNIQQILSAIVENIPNIIYIKDANQLKFLSLNQAGETLLGYSRKEFVGKTDYDLFPPEIAERFIHQDRQTLSQGKSSKIAENPIQTKNRQQRTLATQKIPIVDEAGMPQYLLTIAEDITERKKSEQALQKSQATNRALLNAIPDLMLRIKRDGTYVDCKAAKAFEPLLPPEEMLGKNLTQVLPPPLAQRTMESIHQALNTGEVHTQEYQLPDRGKIADYEARAVACGDDEVLIVVRDISDRIAAEAALRASENRFRGIFEQAAVGMILLTQEGRIFRTNQKFCEITGYHPIELLGRNYLNIAHSEDLAQVRAGIAQLVGGERSTISLVQRYMKEEGKTIWVNFTASLICEQQGEIQYLTAVVQDISDRVLAEDTLQEAYSSLREREEQYRTLTHHAPVGIFQTNAQKEIIFVNPFWCKIAGMSAEAARGDGWIQALYPEDRQRALAEWQKEPEERESSIEFRFQRSDRSISWVVGASASLRDERGNYQGEIGTILEITQRKQAEKRLQQQAEREKLIGAMQERIRRSLELSQILNTTVQEVRHFLQCDRVLVYRFKPDWSGAIIAESVGEPWMAVLNTEIYDPCFTQDFVETYRKGRIHIVRDINTANLAPCHQDLLAQLQVRANLVVPILQGEHLWGLLVAHHCAGARWWRESEIDFLKHLATQVGIATQQSQLYQQLKEANQKLHRLATIDSLTQIANRRCFDAYLEAEWRRMTREQTPLSLIIGDIDDFKRYNDTHGHLAGDVCLKQVATIIRHTLKRPADLVARYGGEEFAIVLPNTNEQGMMWIAQTIRKAVKGLNIPHPTSQVSDRVTLSLGGASLVPSMTTSPEKLIAAADSALYRAKAQGRDRVVAYQPPEASDRRS